MALKAVREVGISGSDDAGSGRSFSQRSFNKYYQTAAEPDQKSQRTDNKGDDKKDGFISTIPEIVTEEVNGCSIYNIVK